MPARAFAALWIGAALKFTEPERAFLVPPRLAHLATVGPGGVPHVVPHWYAVEEDVFYFTTVTTRRTAQYLALDPRTAFVVDDAMFEGRQGIEIEATVVFVPDEAERLAWVLALRYLGPVEGPPYAKEMMAVPGRSAFRAFPRRVRSWGL